MRSSVRWTCPPAADPRRRRLGLGLLEVLVAIAIVAAIAAVALPWTWSRLNRATLPETADRILATLLLARAEAMRSGRLVEVVFEPADASESMIASSGFGSRAAAGDRLRVRHFDPDAFDAGAAPIFEMDLDPEARGGVEAPDGSSPDSIRGSWTVMTIPEDLRLRPQVGGPRQEFAEESDAEPALDEAFAALADEGVDPLESFGSFETSETVTQPLAIFLPDGSNVLAGRWWLEERSPDDRLPPPELDRRRRVSLDLDDAAGMPRRGEIERIVPTMAGMEP